MPGITSGVGLISGFPIQDTIDKLISLASRPKELLLGRNQAAQSQQIAIGKLESLVLAIQTHTQKLAKLETFDKKKVTSADDKLLSAVVTNATSATTGNYNFVPVRLAKAQQILSSGLASNTQPLGAGTFSLGYGGFVNESVSLDQLNGGAGVRAGKIKITDRSGTTGEVDLRFAVTVDDVLQAINSQTTVNVQAVAAGDGIKLIDKTGQTTSNLRVQEVGNGSTAADLGLSGIDVSANSATGQDLVDLFNNLSLKNLNNGNGVSIRKAVPDLDVTFRDGSAALQIDFDDETTLGELLTTINAADPARLQAQISADGDHLEFLDLTSGAGTFAVSSYSGGTLAEDLGLTSAASGGTITSDKLHAGLKTSLLSSLNGGSGLGQLGTISLTDRSGATANVDLSAANTLDDVLTALNNSGLGITAAYNDARNGIQLLDTTGATTSNLIVANADATNSADKLQLAANSTAVKVNSGSLKLQSVSASTTLSALNGGKGIYLNSIVFTDSTGAAGSIRLLDSQFQTVGDVIDGINALGIGVEAGLNAAGDGIQLIDTAGGNLKLKVRDVGSAGRAAKELHLAGESTTQNIGGIDKEVINGSNTLTVTLDADDTLQDLVTKINDLNVGLSAAAISVGGGATPYRLSLTSERTGRAGQFLVDASDFTFSLTQTTAGQDALISLGAGNITSGLLVSSNSNDFENVVNGVKLTVKGESLTSIAVNVAVTNEDFIDNVKKFVESYNKLRTELDTQTAFSEDASQRGELFGTHIALRLDRDFSNLLSGRINGAGSIKSLEEIGLSLDDKGKLQLNESDLNDKLNSAPAEVREFFTKETTGVAVRLNSLIEELSGKEKSLIESQKKSLQDRIDGNQKRIDQLTIRLANQRELLEKQFNAMETALAKLQSNQSALTRLAQLANSTSSSTS